MTLHGELLRVFTTHFLLMPSREWALENNFNLAVNISFKIGRKQQVFILGITFHLKSLGISLAVQWLGLRAFPAEGLGSIPGQGTKFLQAAQCGQKKKSLIITSLMLVSNIFQ